MPTEHGITIRLTPIDCPACGQPTVKEATSHGDLHYTCDGATIHIFGEGNVPRERFDEWLAAHRDLSPAMQEHGFEIPAEILRALPHFEDESWHNDVCPVLRWHARFSLGQHAELWVAEEDPSQREFPDDPRYHGFWYPTDTAFERHDDNAAIETIATDDAQEVIDWMLGFVPLCETCQPDDSGVCEQCGNTVEGWEPS